ncbi:protein FAM200A-like [Ornithodoros turicata]|uniref:protein FAM200A-like n=1 Tax=Ornithodoros turicata TaxID=34597 RepID=UPI0031388D8C
MNPIQENLETDLPPSEEDSLIELSCDTSLKLKFAQGHLADFWIGVRSEHPALSERALKLLLPFPTTYLCEVAFSALVHIKSKSRNRIEVEPDLRLRLSSIEPDISALVASSK